MSVRAPALCYACTRLIGGTATCTSFPEGIPFEIIGMAYDHRLSWYGEPPFELDPARMDAYTDFTAYAPGGSGDDTAEPD